MKIDEFVTKIIEQVFGMAPTSVEEIKGKGKNNLVFKVAMGGKVVILRMSSREGTLELYQKEKWCAEIVRNAGVPTPKILEVGMCEEYAFSFQEFVEGVGGKDVSEKAGGVWFILGQYAKVLHGITAPNIQLDYRKFIGELFVDNYFVTQDVFSEEISNKIQTRLEETFVWEFSPTLCHGNLLPSNTIVDPTGVVHVIDWETATGNRTPQAELAEIYTWNTGKESIARFVEGYGLTESEVMGMMRDIQTLVLLRLVHVIVRKMPQDGNWEQDKYIQETSAMLADIPDYNQDILFTKNL